MWDPDPPALGLWGHKPSGGCAPAALNPALRFPQKYTEEVLSAADPSQPPPPSLQHFLEQPVERIQQYQALLKVGRADQGLRGHPRAQPPQVSP